MEKAKTPLNWLSYSLIFIFGLIIGALLLYFLESTNTTHYLSSNDTSNTKDENAPKDNTETNEESANTTQNVKTTTFTGNYITAELPQGWTIVEYNDKNGSDMIMEGIVYSEFVGLKVFNSSNNEMFYLKAVDGIGGVSGCNEIFKFSDSDNAYIVAGNDFDGTSGVTPNVIDLTSQNHSEYTLLGFNVRRVDHNIYRDAYNSHYSGFNPGCGIDRNIFQLTSLNYKSVVAGVTQSGHTYSWGIPSNAPLNDLETLDNVLESIVIN